MYSCKCVPVNVLTHLLTYLLMYHTLILVSRLFLLNTYESTTVSSALVHKLQQDAVGEDRLSPRCRHLENSTTHTHRL